MSLKTIGDIPRRPLGIAGASLDMKEETAMNKAMGT